MIRLLLGVSMIFLFATSLVCAQPQAVFKRFTPDQEIFNNEQLFASDDSTYYVAGGQQFPAWGTNVTKFDIDGTPIWSKRYSYTTYERYPDIHVTSWGDILITTYPPNLDFKVRCVDGNGNYKWGTVSSNVLRNFHTTSFDDSTIYIVGYSSGGPYIFKTNSAGALKWEKAYWNVSLNAFDFNEVVQVGATRLLIGGYSQTYGTTVVMHLDSSGAVLSSRLLIPSIPAQFGFWKMKFYKLAPNKIWISGVTGKDAVIAESDSSGNIQWVRKLSSPGCRLGTMSLSAFPSGEIAFSGIYNDTINAFRGSCAGILHADGTFDHAFRFGADSVYGHDNVDVVALKNGKLVVSAFERVLPINSTYNPIIGSIDSAYTGNGSCYTEPVQLFSDTMSFSYTFIATDSASTSYPSYFLSPFGVVPSVPYDSLLCISITSVEEPEVLNNTISVYPNPASGSIFLSGTHAGGMASLYDVRGRLNIQILCEEGQTSLDLGKLPPGLYLLNYSWHSGHETRKVMVADSNGN